VRHKSGISDPSGEWVSGATDGGACLEKEHIAIDPADESKVAQDNYKLLISEVVPRPIGFISTRSSDGKAHSLAPMSYSQVVNSDLSVFCIGLVGGLERMKDTLKNLVDMGEGVIISSASVSLKLLMPPPLMARSESTSGGCRG
jgi:hypothetical protein